VVFFFFLALHNCIAASSSSRDILSVASIPTLQLCDELAALLDPRS
jgi:hypothetical protein